jgi:PAS domain S-box-containing protein
MYSKSNNIEFTRLGLELKAVIDQIREQVQNIVAPTRAANGAVIGTSTIAHEFTARKGADAANAQLAGIVRSSRDGIASFSLDGTVLTWNPGLERMLGYTADEVISHNRSFFVPNDRPDEQGNILAAIRAGRDLSLETIRLHKDGRRIEVALTCSPLRAPEGNILGFCTIVRDISERKRREERQQQLIDELDHRVKNSLAATAVVVERSREGAPSIEAFATALVGRINSMARTHASLSRNQWAGIGLRELVADELAPYRTEANTLIEGPDFVLPQRAARAISMALHELATNAAKHGALSRAHGHVTVTWKRIRDSNGSARLLLKWRETGHSGVPTQQRQGFGTTVIRDLLRYELGGRVELNFAPGGVRCEIETAAF